MSDEESNRIDAAILSIATGEWLKTARIAFDVMRFLGDRSDEFLDKVLARIETLRAQGKLEAAGDIMNMRASEIRLSS